MPPAAMHSPIYLSFIRPTSIPWYLLVLCFAFCEFDFLFEFFVKLLGDFTVELTMDHAGLSRFLEARFLLAEICASAGFLSGKVNGHFSLRGTDYTDEIPLGEALSTAGAPSFGHLFGFNCRILHYM
jgi:hypothetical protein